jgi:antitoxin ParD1/3/4
MSITLKPEQEQILQQQVTLGRFKSTDEVLESALRLLVEQYQDYEAWVEEVRSKVDEAKAEADRGEVLPLETVMAQLQSKFQQAREQRLMRNVCC